MTTCPPIFFFTFHFYCTIILLLLSVYISAAFFMLRWIFVIYYVSVSAFAEHKFHRNDYNMDITVNDRFCWTYWLVCIFVSISQEEYWSRTGQLVFHSDQTRVEDVFFDFIGSRQTGREPTWPRRLKSPIRCPYIVEIRIINRTFTHFTPV